MDEINARMKFIPTEAQRRITSHLLAHPIAAVFAGMGLGKTAATLDAIDTLITDLRIDGALIIAPLRVAVMTWPAEVAKWDHTSWMRVANLRTEEGRKQLRDGSAQLYVINFELLQNFAEWAGKMKTLPFQAVVIDELSVAKDHGSKRIKAIRPILWKHCQYRWGLTGTPAPNSRLNLFGQFLLLDQGKRLGAYYTRFRDRYFKQADYWGYKWEEREDTPSQIDEAIGDITLSMRTSDWLDLPDVIEKDVEVNLPPKAEKIYRTMEEECLIRFRSGSMSISLNAAVTVTKLMQIASGSIYVNGGKQYEVVHHAKVKAVARLLEKIEGNTLVIYQWQHELDQLKLAIPSAVPFDSDCLDDWNAGKINVMLCHPRSMSHGLNLQHGGQNIIWVSPTYSRESYDQLNARLHRKGQDKVTTVYRVLAKDTIDWVVVEALREKGNRQDALLEALKRYKR